MAKRSRHTRQELADLEAANHAHFDQLTEAFAPFVRAGLHAYLAAARMRLAQRALPTLTTRPTGLLAAAQSPIARNITGTERHSFTQADAAAMTAALDEASTEWPGILSRTIMPGLRTMIAALPESLPSDDPRLLSDMMTWRSQWLQQREQALVNVPDEVTSQLRTELDTLAQNNGTDVWDAKLAAEDMLADGYPSWEGRAMLIARTECLPGDAVVTGANAHTLYRRWYEGEWVEIETETGRKLSGTPNHPVLTTRGWVGLAQLTERDRLVCHGPDIEETGPAGHENIEHPPAPIAEIFKAAAAVVIGERVTTGQPDFHGDGVDGEVEVLAPDRLLRVGNMTPVEEGGLEFHLSPPDLATVLLAAACAPFGSRLTVDERTSLRRTANGLAGFLNDARHDPSGDPVGARQVGRSLPREVTLDDLTVRQIQSRPGGPEPAGILGGGGLGSSPGPVATLAEDSTDRGRVRRTGNSDHRQGRSGPVHVEDLRLVKRLTWSGHVYNLSTSDGYFAVNGVYTGNTVSANNMANFNAWSSLADATGLQVEKVWIGGTRPTHSAVNGTQIPIGEKFHVGESEMVGPGDGAGGAAEVCNCKCALGYEILSSDSSGGDGETATTTPSLATNLTDGSDQADLMTAAVETRDTPTEHAGSLLAAAEGNTGACLMLYCDPGTAARLAQPGFEAAEDLHITLGFFDKPAAEFTPEERAQFELNVSNLLNEVTMPITAEAFAVAHFNPDDPERDPCAVLLVQSDQLALAHDGVLAATALAGTKPSFPVWVPHITIGYGLDPALIPTDALGPVTFDRLVMAWGDQQTQISPGATISEDLMTQPTTGVVEALKARAAQLFAGVVADPPAADTGTPPVPEPAAPADPTAPEESAGPTWSGPLAVLGTPSSDGRKLRPGGGIIRPLPLPLSYQEKSGDRHDGSTRVGRILAAEDRGDVLWAHGDYLDPFTAPDVEKAHGEVDAGLGLCSVDIAPHAVSFENADGEPIDPATYEGDDLVVVFEEWEFGGATIVGFPAFGDARIANDQPAQEETPMPATAPGQVIDIVGGEETFAGANPEGPTISDDGTSITLVDGTVVGVGDEVTVPGDATGDGGGDTDTGTITAIDPAGQTVDIQITPDNDGDADDDPNNPMTVTVPIATITPSAGPQRPDPADQAPPGGGPADGFALDEDTDIALLASSYRQPYRGEFFAKRSLPGPTPLTVNRETGEIYGHFAENGECHIGKLAQNGICVTYPPSPTQYEDYFHLRPVETDQGPIQVGLVTVGTGHAHERAGFRGAVEHYDHTGTQVAVVRAYDDEWGGQFTGQLIHGVDPKKVDELELSGQLSGDWRTMKGSLELVAALAVNVPGFAVRNRKRISPRYGMVGDRQVSLVAAGLVYPQDHTDVVLPSGTTLARDEWDALVASVEESWSRRSTRTAALAQADQVLLARTAARARLARMSLARHTR